MRLASSALYEDMGPLVVDRERREGLLCESLHLRDLLVVGGQARTLDFPPESRGRHMDCRIAVDAAVRSDQGRGDGERHDTGVF